MAQANPAWIDKGAKLSVPNVEDFLHDSAALHMQTITLYIPLLQNPNKLGIRVPTSPMKLWETLQELKIQFSGFTLSLGIGWCAEDRMWDPHLCVEIDTKSTLDVHHYLYSCKRRLEERFRQRSIYIKTSSPISWV